MLSEFRQNCEQCLIIIHSLFLLPRTSFKCMYIQLSISKHYRDLLRKKKRICQRWADKYAHFQFLSVIQSHTENAPIFPAEYYYCYLQWTKTTAAIHSSKISENFETGTNFTDISGESMFPETRGNCWIFWTAKKSTESSGNSGGKVKWDGNSRK